MAAVIEDLKFSLQQTESASDEYQRQLSVLQARLDDAVNEQAKLEEQVHECNDRAAALESEKKESDRRTREMEAAYEDERIAMVKAKEDQDLKEAEMQTVIQRLKECLAQKDMRMNFEGDGRLSRTREIFQPRRPVFDG